MMEKNSKRRHRPYIHKPNIIDINFDMDNDIKKIVNKLEINGFKCYIVGGAIRDLLLGKEPKDYDIVTNANPDKVRQVFKGYSYIIGRRFKLCLVNIGGRQFEISTLRDANSYDYKNWYSNSISDDYTRRDFTINALYYNPIKKHIIDYCNGIKDLENGIIRTVIPHQIIFEEDPVRILRLFKFQAMFRFIIDTNLYYKAQESLYLIESIQKSRLFAEFEKIFQNKLCLRIIYLFYKMKIFDYIIKDFDILNEIILTKNNDVKLMRVLYRLAGLNKQKFYMALVKTFKNILRKNKDFPIENLQVIIPVDYFG